MAIIDNRNLPNDLLFDFGFQVLMSADIQECAGLLTAIGWSVWVGLPIKREEQKATSCK